MILSLLRTPCLCSIIFVGKYFCHFKYCIIFCCHVCSKKKKSKQEATHCACAPRPVKSVRTLFVFNGYFCSMALVPYVENPLPALSKLHSSSAQFRFVDRDVRLAQDWRRLGVAAVVWDAVSVGSLDASRPAGCHCLNLTGPRVCVCSTGGCHVHVPGAGEGGCEGEGGDRTGSWNWSGGNRSRSDG